jgi:hypothetical protein
MLPALVAALAQLAHGKIGMALRDLFGLPVGGVYGYNDPRDSVVMGSARGKQADDGIIP